MADSLAKVLGNQGFAVERSARDQGVENARSLVPDLILLAGDAAQNRGAAVLAQLGQLNPEAPVPVVVMSAPELAGSITQQPARHVAHISLASGTSACARQVHALVELLAKQGLVTRSLQELTDTLTPQAGKHLTHTSKQPAQAAVGHAAPLSGQSGQAPKAPATAHVATPPKLPVTNPKAPVAIKPEPAKPPPLVSASAPKPTSSLSAGAQEPQPTAAVVVKPAANDKPQATSVAAKSGALPQLPARHESEPRAGKLPEPPPLTPRTQPAIAISSTAPKLATMSKPATQLTAATPVNLAQAQHGAEPSHSVSTRPTTAPTMQAQAAEPEFAVSLSEPAPPAAQRADATGVVTSDSLARQDALGGLARQDALGGPARQDALRRARNPLEPAVWTQPQPAPVTSAAAPVTVSGAARPQTSARARNPLEPAVWTGTQPQPARAAAVTPEPAASLEEVTAHATYPAANRGQGREPWPTAPQRMPAPNLAAAETTPRRSKALLIGLAAVSGCALLSLWALHESSATSDPNAALGALQQVPSAPAAQPRANLDAAGAAANMPPTWPRAQDDQQVAASAAPNGVASNPRAHDQARQSEPAAEKSPTQTLVDEGVALALQGRLGLAESAYQKALRATPEYPDAMAGLVRVHLARRDAVEAVRWANRLVAKQPANGANQLLLGDALALRGDDDAARAAWQEAVKRGNATARQRLE